MAPSRRTHLHLFLGLDDSKQILGIRISNRNDQSPTLGKLINEWLRNFRSPCCNDDRIEWTLFRPSGSPVGELDFDIKISQLINELPRLYSE
jgi:hypothetical protein